MQLFLCTNISGNTALLSEEESRHCIKVLRKKNGDTVQLIDGQGGFYTAVIADAHPRSCSLTIISREPNYKKRPYNLHIAIAPTKNTDRIEWFVEKAVEIGVDEISFIQCQASERKVVKTERIVKVVESAVKQSVQAYMPVVNELLPFRKFIEAQKEAKAKKFIAHCMDGDPPHLKNVALPAENILCLIGPEGDFNKEELELAVKIGFSGISLGLNRLRTETAALYVCNVVALINS
jgi:16S rRNA (uracil1498-N3)-methyltransferase